MRHVFFIILIFFLFTTSVKTYAQEIDFYIHGKTVLNYLQEEAILGGQYLPNKSKIISYNEIAQPIKYLRMQDSIPPLITHYYFFEQDSAMAYCLYEWDILNFTDTISPEQKEIWKHNLAQKYFYLNRIISSRYGNGKNAGGLMNTNTSIIYNLNKWQPNDSLEIEMFTRTVYNDTLKYTEVHHIQLFIRTKERRETTTPELPAERVDMLKMQSIAFLNYLENNRFDDAKNKLSPMIKNNVDKKELKALKKNIHFENDIELSMYGAHYSFNGRLFATLQFIYKDDNDEQMLDMLKIIFDSNNKIYSVQPINAGL